MEPELTPMQQEQNDWARSFDLGSDPNYAAYYANGESEAFAGGFVDGRLSLYGRVEDEGGGARDPEKAEAVRYALFNGVWAAIREIENQEEG